MGCWVVVIPTVASQSVLCSDSPVFQWSFLIMRFTSGGGNYGVWRLTVCHFHVQNCYYLTMPR